jgi:hypothetical protein
MMAKQTKKFVAATATAKANGIRPALSSEVLYKRLEEAGYWWDAANGNWTNAPKPARGRRISIEGLNARSSDKLLQIRIVAPEERIAEVVSDFTRFAEMRGYTFLQQSDPYPADVGARVYMEFVMPPAVGFRTAQP